MCVRVGGWVRQTLENEMIMKIARLLTTVGPCEPLSLLSLSV